MTPTRDSVVNALQVLSSKESQYELLLRSEAVHERRAPLNLADELWSLWTKAYLPQQARPVLELAATDDALERFTAFFRHRRALLPDRFESLMTDVHWLGVIEYARVLLAQLSEIE